MSTPLPTRRTSPSGELFETQAPTPLPFARKEFRVRAISPGGFEVVVTMRDVSFETLEKALEQLVGAGYTPLGGAQ